MERPIILCVDDERVILDALSAQLDAQLGDDYEYETANSGEEALEVAESLMDSGQKLAVIISDQMMPNMTGDELLVRMHRLTPDTNKILLTGQASADAVGRALNEAKLYRYITKPWEPTDLIMTIQEAVRSFQQKQQITQQTNIMESLYFASKILGRANKSEELFQKLAEIIIDHTKAQRVALFQFKNDQLFQPVIYKKVDALGSLGKLPPIIPDDNTQVCFTLIEQALNKRLTINVSNANVQPWGSDPYIQQYKPKSLYVIPIILDNRLEGLFYLEHFDRYSTFGREVNEFMNLFTPQAAIHLENTELYAGLERKVTERTQELQHQKQIVEEKNKDIQDSIVYASRLQDALFPATDAFYQFFSDSEIYLRPKDVVSGDFYWYEIQGDVIYFAAADCTGHGVPGALLSIMGNNLLTDIVKSNPGIEPAHALTQLHQALLAKLRQKSDNHPLDGMDIALCRYDRISRNLIFAGAGRPLFHFRNNELIEYKSEKNCIGGHTPVDYPFTQTVIHVAQGDLIYLFSDGYTDQFGGNSGSAPRKMTTRPLREIIVNDSASSIHSINENLIQQFNDWKGNIEQTDDMLLIGVRIT